MLLCSCLVHNCCKECTPNGAEIDDAFVHDCHSFSGTRAREKTQQCTVKAATGAERRVAIGDMWVEPRQHVLAGIMMYVQYVDACVDYYHQTSSTCMWSSLRSHQYEERRTRYKMMPSARKRTKMPQEPFPVLLLGPSANAGIVSVHARIPGIDGGAAREAPHRRAPLRSGA